MAARGESGRVGGEVVANVGHQQETCSFSGSSFDFGFVKRRAGRGESPKVDHVEAECCGMFHFLFEGGHPP